MKHILISLWVGIGVPAQTLTSTKTEQIECAYQRDLFYALDKCDKDRRECSATLSKCEMDKDGLHLLINQYQHLIESPPKPPEPETHTDIIVITVTAVVSAALGYLLARAL